MPLFFFWILFIVKCHLEAKCPSQKLLHFSSKLILCSWIWDRLKFFFLPRLKKVKNRWSFEKPKIKILSKTFFLDRPIGPSQKKKLMSVFLFFSILLLKISISDIRTCGRRWQFINYILGLNDELLSGRSSLLCTWQRHFIVKESYTLRRSKAHLILHVLLLDKFRIKIYHWSDNAD